MGRRSDFERIGKDFYRTIDSRAVAALAPYLPPDVTYAEPCVGQRDLVIGLASIGAQCDWDSDEEFGAINLEANHIESCALIITNPPWTRKILHPLIEHLSALKPTWLLFDAAWAHTVQSAPYMKHCRAIVSVGRLIWIPGTTMSGKDDCAWYLFDQSTEGPVIFYGRH